MNKLLQRSSFVNKTFVLVMLVFLIGGFVKESNAQNRPETMSESDSFFARRDSILKETDNGSVYITRDRTSELYDRFTRINVDLIEFNEVFDDEFIGELLSHGTSNFKHLKNELIRGDWCPLYYYEGQFYVYAPSDWMYNQQLMITDSVVYKVCCVDPDMILIENYRVSSEGIVKFALCDYSGSRTNSSIQFLDTNQTIALWSYHDDNGAVLSYELKVRADSVREYDMIVNDCGDQKCFREFIAELSDYEAVLERFSIR